MKFLFSFFIKSWNFWRPLDKLHCMNTEGSYFCGCRDGFSKIEKNNRNECNDINECRNENSCPENGSCQNTEGSFRCLCDFGYEMKDGLCNDVNECTSNVTKCDENADCYNTDGSYECSCREGHYGSGESCIKGQCNNAVCFGNKQCVSLTKMDCECREGFLLNTIGNCSDIDECSAVNDCDEHAECVNLAGSYACSCQPGFYGNGSSCSVGNCTDDVCPLHEVCVLPTSSECECSKGFIRNDAGVCTDVNECSAQLYPCHTNSDCTNTDGSYHCACNAGYFGDGKNCLPGQCQDAYCPLNQMCTSPTTVSCQCKTGFSFDENQKCVDIDECLVENQCDENATCVNTIGSFSCKTYRSVLVLNSLYAWKPAVVINHAGEHSILDCFERDNKTDAVGSCSFSWQNKMHIFGGDSEPRQISRLDNYRLKRIGDLPFNNLYGTCTTMTPEFIFMCFNWGQNDDKRCRRATDPLGNFTDIVLSHHQHIWTQASTSNSKGFLTNQS